MQKNIDSIFYEFNGFRLEESQHRLLYKGQPVQIKPKILDLLLFLVQMRGRLVVKEDLMREIWPDAIVEENNITVSMSILRKILRDRVNREFIETVPRRGYRFVGEVNEIPGEFAARVDVAPSVSTLDVEEEPIDSLAVIPM